MATYVRDYTALVSADSTWNQAVGGTLKPTPVFVSYSFTATRPEGINDRMGFADPNYFRQLSAAEQQLVRDAFKTWDDVSGITFFEVPAGMGDIDIGVYDLATGIAGYGSMPSSKFFLRDGQFNIYGPGNNPHQGLYLDYQSGLDRHVILHEIGHALGLEHPHEGDRRLPADLDNGNVTVMSYKDYFPKLGTMDLQAIQALYGTNAQDGTQVADWSWNDQTHTLTQWGTAASETFKGTNSDDIIYGGGGRDIIIARAGNDTIYVSGKSFEISAGPGFDVIHTDFAYSEIGWTSLKNNYLSFYLKTGSGWDMVISEGERVVFTDGVLATDIDGNAGQMYRLYQAAFDRTPDHSGLGYWIRELDKGIKVAAIAESFLASDEFQKTFGTQDTVTNSRFIDLLYTHTLGRQYDQGGFNYWVGKLNANETNRSDLLAFFSNSDENKLKVAAQVEDGIWYV